jgi:hypothetical protein
MMGQAAAISAAIAVGIDIINTLGAAAGAGKPGKVERWMRTNGSVETFVNVKGAIHELSRAGNNYAILKDGNSYEMNNEWFVKEVRLGGVLCNVYAFGSDGYLKRNCDGGWYNWAFCGNCNRMDDKTVTFN